MKGYCCDCEKATEHTGIRGNTGLPLVCCLRCGIVRFKNLVRPVEQVENEVWCSNCREYEDIDECGHPTQGDPFLSQYTITFSYFEVSMLQHLLGIASFCWGTQENQEILEPLNQKFTESLKDKRRKLGRKMFEYVEEDKG